LDAAPPSTALRVSSVAKSFPATTGDVEVLRHIDLDVTGPCIVTVVGTNGVGKSTFLRILAGLLEAERGLVDFTPALVAGAFGYMPQSNPVLPWRRVDEDIALPLQIQGVPRGERRARAREAVGALGVDLPLAARCDSLSGGQRQVVNLCRAMIAMRTNSVLLMDEPFSSLDPMARVQVARHLQTVLDLFRPLIILTSHDLDLAIMCSDVIIPFRHKPVEVRQSDLMRVRLPRPREPEARQGAEYQQLLIELERIFYGGPQA
jgi:ABC-type nitrate/sulfonate/bicarbonate transport system ATPase subunit